MHLQIHPHDPAPVYRQIQRQIARAIVDRQIHPGDLLESHENLAMQLAVSPAAVRKAYEGLRSDGLCDVSSGDRYRVAAPGLGLWNGDRIDLAVDLLRREFLAHELRTARRAQHRLLPPAEICRDCWTIRARSLPAGALTGDFYEVVEHEDGIVDLVVADVAGKGLAAGLIMATAKSMVAWVAVETSPAAALHELNRRLLPVLDPREFVALAYARFDPADGRLQLANAGLPDPYLLRRQEAEAISVSGDRLPLGIRRDISYRDHEVSLAPGDRILLITDGLPEATDRRGKPLGYKGFLRLLALAGEPAAPCDPSGSDSWLDRLFARVGHLTGSMPQDDWTLAVLESHPV